MKSSKFALYYIKAKGQRPMAPSFGEGHDLDFWAKYSLHIKALVVKCSFGYENIGAKIPSPNGIIVA